MTFRSAAAHRLAKAARRWLVRSNSHCREIPLASCLVVVANVSPAIRYISSTHGLDLALDQGSRIAGRRNEARLEPDRVPVIAQGVVVPQ